MFVFKVCDGGATPAVEVPVTAELLIGRSVGAGHCALTDANAGRQAAKVVAIGGRFHLEDLGSRNPTVIRGVGKLSKGERIELVRGMVIEIGRSTLEVAGGPDEAELDPERTLTGDELGSATLVAGAGFSPRDDKTDPADLGLSPSASDESTSRPTRGRAPAPPPAPPPPPRAPAAPQRPTPVPPPATAPAPRTPPTAPPVPAAQARPPTAPPPSSGTLAPAVRPSAEPEAQPQLVGKGTVQFNAKAADKLAVLGALRGARPRLVIVNDADRRIVGIEVGEFVVARESGECRLAHPGVSQPHAKITFVPQTMSFQVEDMGSMNQTLLGAVALNPRVPQPLQPESLLRFGPIEAVFVVARDSSNEPLPEARYAAAVQILTADQSITAQQAQIALADAAASKGERHAGEALMLAGAVSARAWTRAFELAATHRPGSAAAGAAKSKKGLVIALVALVALLATAAALWFFRGALGLG